MGTQTHFPTPQISQEDILKNRSSRLRTKHCPPLQHLQRKRGALPSNFREETFLMALRQQKRLHPGEKRRRPGKVLRKN